jgi:trans-aconitate methyltransferase
MEEKPVFQFGKEGYQDAWTKWDDMKTYGAASRHVRRLVFKLIRGLQFETILDVGCGVGTLLSEVKREFPHVHLAGTEYADVGLEIARQRLPDAQFQNLDLSKEHIPGRYDLVVCVDVLEHIPDDLAAMRNLRAMTSKYLVVVVPIGPLFEVERVRVGHVHGYARKEFESRLRSSGFHVIRVMQWGFPVYNLYRRILHKLPESATTGKYGLWKKLNSLLLYFLLFLNLPFWGERYFALCTPVDNHPMPTGN